MLFTNLRCFCEEVGRHEAAYSANLSDVEAVVIHVSVHVNDVPGAERELHLWVAETRPHHPDVSPGLWHSV